MNECQGNTGLNVTINGQLYNGNVDTGYNLQEINNLQEEIVVIQENINELEDCCSTVQTNITNLQVQVNKNTTAIEQFKNAGLPTYTANADMNNLAAAGDYINWENFSPSHTDVQQTTSNTFTIINPGLYVTTVNRILTTAIGNSITFEVNRTGSGINNIPLPNGNGVFEIGIPEERVPATLKIKTEAEMTAAMGGYLTIQKVRGWA